MDQIKEYYQRWCDMPQPRKIRVINLVAFACYFLFLLLLVIYAFGRTGQRTLIIVPTVLFTDGTPYNMQMIRYLAQRRDVIISMIVVSNNALAVEKLRSNVGNVEGILSALQAEGYTKTVPVYASHTSSPNSFEAPLDEMLAKQSVKFVIVGPCTEAAHFLMAYPAHRSNIVDIFVAGGAFNKAGNANYLFRANAKAERNFYLDPKAAGYITEASHSRPVTLFPIDVTVAWTEEAYAAIVSNPSSTAASVETVATGLRWYYQTVDSTRSTTVGLMAAAYASDAQVRETALYTSIPVRVRTAETNMTNGQSYRPASGTPVRVMLSVAADTFFSHLVNVDKLPLA
ncbi:Inosine-uridine preferring nucleoside hydrolase [Leishmania donovani]|uniref:Inosine-uridine preferring nucleoside hydrolase family protein n=1 Tax=Leishmania donovani TaxID=5661 RepID=A0A504XSH6_LEIDO|nr:Inosine-uridine preferring nucleoside hydrolase family protein [Leishmania donovani]CAJ1989621.1 Inosine-uridine preferring nucleoside hydrolase [Leishmania donovani]VDZ45487.1 Inosine-uridine_preferring_nucleoside_hydrolase_putative/Pfam:PF01156 [Leishmania donovani]